MKAIVGVVLAIWLIVVFVLGAAGALGSALASGAAGQATTGPMTRLPLVLIPAYLVPLFVMLHLAALFQARRHAATSMNGRWSPLLLMWDKGEGRR